MWQANDGTRAAYAAAGAANPPEIADRRATATLLRRLVRASGGGAHFIGTGTDGAPPDVPDLRRTEPDRPAAGSSWIGLERRHDHLVTGIAARTLLPAWFALPLMLGSGPAPRLAAGRDITRLMPRVTTGASKACGWRCYRRAIARDCQVQKVRTTQTIATPATELCAVPDWRTDRDRR